MTVLSASIVSVHVGAPPEHGPAQPPKVEPGSAVSVSVTDLPSRNRAEQAAPQLIPAGLLVMVPDPVPLLVIVRVRTAVKVAVTLLFALTVNVHDPVPVQSPLQPVNTKPVAATAVNVTVVSSGKSAEQLAPQLTPAGLLVTVPLPLFVTLTA